MTTPDQHPTLRLPIVDDHLFIDGTAFETFSTCQRAFQYYFLQKRQTAGKRVALESGAIMHLAIQLRRLMEFSHPADEIEWGQARLIELAYRGWAELAKTPLELRYIERELSLLHPEYPTLTPEQRNVVMPQLYPGYTPPLDDFRSQAFVLDTITGYNEEYPIGEEPFSFVTDNLGNPLVEISFAEPMVTLFNSVVHPRPVTIVWTGRIDLPTDWTGELWNMDIKTGTRDNGFEEFANDQAQLGYLWALKRKLGRTPKGFVIDKVFWRAPTKSGKGTEYKRHKEHVDASRLDEWEENTITAIENIFHATERQFFTMHSKWCVGKFGPCPYLDVCRMPVNNRGVLLQSNFYQDVTWNPLRSSLHELLTNTTHVTH